eukprot:TRINITY_DN1634_c0_g1_i1.p1 TRINITY_DN1634_c0_g1~~TRINITY_DN1634_c0_g1_i1.p1  ORF type:complete len:3556 (+),score=333.93 TRINITY_DN1634_c0_g1_i1:6127-16794(+)
MQEALSTLTSHVDVLWEAREKKLTGTKTKRLKSVIAINELLSKKSVTNALTRASRLEMMKGTQQETDAEKVIVAWAELTSIVLVTVDKACMEAKGAKSVSKSGVASLKPDNMTCLRSVINKAIRFGPPGVIRHITPVFLYLSHQWLAEPSLRSIIADQIWQLVKEILHDEENRAMLTPPFIRTWVDVCFEQLTSRGPLHCKSEVVNNIASEVLQLLAKPVPSYDILTQGTRGVPMSKMVGGDYSYAMICERCCLMLVLTESMSRRDARELQATCFRTLTQLLQDYAVNFVGSSALESIINVTLRPIVGSWTDRRYHDPAVSLAKVLVLLAPNHTELSNELRRRFLADVKDQSASATLRTSFDVKDDFVDTAAACFSFAECVNFIKSSVGQKGHLILWLRVIYSILSRRVLKNETSVLVNGKLLENQTREFVVTVTDLLKSKLSTRDNKYSEVMQSIARAVQTVFELMGRMDENNVLRICWESGVCENLYKELWNHASRDKVERPSSVDFCGRRKTEGWFHSFVYCLNLLHSRPFSGSIAHASSRTGNEDDGRLQYPLSKITESNEKLSGIELKYIRNILAKNGVPEGCSTQLRKKMLNRLFAESHIEIMDHEDSSERLMNFSSAFLSLSRGACLLYEQASEPIPGDLCQDGFDMDSLFYLNIFFSMNMDKDIISGHGSHLCAALSRHLRTWDDAPPGVHIPLIRVHEQSEALINSAPHSQREEAKRCHGRHFAVDPTTTRSLEAFFLSKVRNLLRLPTERSGDLRDCSPPSQTGSGNEMNEENSLKEEFEKELDAVSGIKLVLVLSNYFLEGLELGLVMSSIPDSEKGNNTLGELKTLLTMLLQKLSNTSSCVFVAHSELTTSMISVSLSLMRYIESETEQKTLQYEELDFAGLSETILRTIKSMSRNLSDYMIHKIRERAEKCVRRIESCYSSSSTFCNNVSTPGCKRRAAGESSVRKRRRVCHDVSVNEGDGCGKRFSDESQSGKEDREKAGVDYISSDDSNEFICKLGQADSDTHHPRGNEGSPMDWGSARAIQKTSQLIRLMTVQNRQAAEVVFEILRKGIQLLNDIQLTLSPDGFERSSLLSDLFDDGFLDLKVCLWSTFLSIGTCSATVIAGDDILKFGTMWKEAEDVSRKYVHLYTESFSVQKRKHYPVPQKLEVARIAFLEYSRAFLLQFRKEEMMGRLRHHIESPDSALPKTLIGIMTIVDHFRSNYAFRMPRAVRTSYLRVSVTFMEMMSNCFESFIHPRQIGMALSDLGKVLNSTRNAVLKFLSDPEGSIRVLASHLIPRLLGDLHFSNITEIESFVGSFLPKRLVCFDDSSPYSPDNPHSPQETDGLVQAQWDLSLQEFEAHKRITASFLRVGSLSKGFTSLLSLTEAAMAQEALIPFFYMELFERVFENFRLGPPAYFAILRLCGIRGYESPKRFFQLFARLVLHKCLNNRHTVEILHELPVFLTLDINHHQDGIQFCWMREYQSLLIPYFLIHENPEELPSFKLLSKLADDLETSTSVLLSTNVASFSLIYPMHFIDSMHVRARKLWNAIDACVGGNSKKLMSQNTDSVITGLLRSIYTNFKGNLDMNIPVGKIESNLGFLRDATNMNPPFYDPLVIALSINQLYKSDPKLFIMSRKVLQGSIFAEVRIEETRRVIASDFSAFVKECQRRNGTLVRVLLTISRFLVGVPPEQPIQNRRDAFFCVGVLWRMISTAVLTKSVYERRMFYMLLARGFEHPETVFDAAWLLLDVQGKVARLHSDFSTFSVSKTDLSSDPDISEHLSRMTSSQERVLYELLSAVSPILVSVLMCSDNVFSEELSAIVSEALKRLVLLCAELEVWTVILANGPFPAHRRLAHVRKLYQSAKTHVHTDSIDETIDRALEALNRFRGKYKLQRSIAPPPIFLACLQELNTELNDHILSELSRRVQAEAWLKSCGMDYVVAPRISDAITCTIDLVHTASHNIVQSNASGNLRSSSTPFRQINSSNAELRDTIMQESASLLSKLGVINLYSTPIYSTKNYHRRIPARSTFGKYEDVQSGAQLSLFLLEDLLCSAAPIKGLTAFETLNAILKTKEGHAILGTHFDRLEPVSFLRIGDQAADSSGKRRLAGVLLDPQYGDKISIGELPGVIDAELWSYGTSDLTDANALDQWVRRFCAAFANACQSKAMQALSPACFASYEVSCQVMPYLLMDTICDLDARHLSIVSDLLKTQVLCSSKAPNALRRLFIHALDVLCQIGLAVAFKDGVSNWFQKTDRTYPCYYVFEVPYYEVAAAALSSGAYFSAIRFSELHVNQEEIQFEFCRPPRTKRENFSNYDGNQLLKKKLDEARARVRPIVQEAMNQISEPDGKTAFNSSEELAALVANVAGFNGEWAALLGALDLSNDQPCSNEYVVDPISQTPGNQFTSADSAIDLNHEVKRFKCFMGLGTLKVACAYWEELRRRLATIDSEKSNASLAKHCGLLDELNEMRYATAWKLQQWESPKRLNSQNYSMSNSTSGRIGFHEAVYNILDSLRAERFTEVSKTLIKARNSALGSLVEDTASVSAGGVYQLASQLNVLEFLDRRNSEGSLPNPSVDAPIVLQAKGGGEVIDRSEPDLCSKRNVVSFAGTRGKPWSERMRHITSTGTHHLDCELLICLLNNEAKAEEDKFFPMLQAFDNSILTAELPAVLFRCLKRHTDVALASAVTSARVLSEGGVGCWARAAFCLGTLRAASLHEADKSKVGAWKLQDARLRWYSNHDACSRRQALDAVNSLISEDLNGKPSERQSDDGCDDEKLYQCIDWAPSHIEDPLLHFLRVEACSLAAMWSLDMRTHEPMDLYKLYLESGLKAAQHSQENRTLAARAHLAMASFANDQIRNIEVYKKSRTFEEMSSALEDIEGKIKRMKKVKEGRMIASKRLKGSGHRSSRSQMSSGSKLSRELDGLINNEERKARIERERVEKLNNSYRRWQLLACKHFAACLRAGTSQDLKVAFRMVAIWLDSGTMRNAITAALIRKGVGSTSGNMSIDVPVSKLLPLAPQLMSRLNSSDSLVPNHFQNALAHTIIDMASDFPSHCLWQLLALTNSTRECATEERYAAFYRGDKGKKEAAEEILKNVRQRHGSTVSQMRKISDAYIALSETDSKSKQHGKKFDLRSYSLLRLGKLKNVPIPTIPLPICTNDRLETLPYVHGFERYATVCSGLSKPLSIVCIGSDGHRYPQLVKGKDDLRGDAVMEQMFMIVNKLLQKDDKAAARKLSIRTYRIVPLSPFSGIMQFVNNTKHLKDVLIEKSSTSEHRTVRKSLHERYRPRDLKYQSIFERAYNEYTHRCTGQRDVPRTMKYLKSIWSKFQPVFRHFFIEEWPDAEEWFQHQLNYSRSVAVMSVVGFILGIGDRHLSNILMDIRTAEVVHIDFGIAFEKGKLLPTPELMPFRLTRDIVDGFGIAGVEGVFRRCCETTLQVLRQNKDVVLTVIDVLLHDPMFTWALTPVEVLKEQEALEGGSLNIFEGDGSSGSFSESAVDDVARKVDRKVNGSREAQRAMSRISEKLDGLEGTERLSVEAHVARLIDEARAFHVIGAVYPGWSPWV